MDFRDFLLNEMMVHKLVDNPRSFIAFRGHLWLYHDGISEQEAKKIYKTILKEHPQKKEISKSFASEEHGPVYDYPWARSLEDWVRDEIPDSFVGEWDAKKRIIWIQGSNANPVTSSLVKKVVDALKARSVQYETENSFTRGNPDAYPKPQSEYWGKTVKYGKKDILGRLPEIAYHGTATKYLQTILKTGLQPGQAESNYGEIQHDNRVFLANKFDEAEYHSTHTAEKTHTWPVVIAFKIPDPALIVPDYDADLYSTGPTYPNFTGHQPSKYSSVNPMKTSKHLGVFGYQGRIPAKFIEGVYLRINKNWKKVRLDTLKKRIDNDPWEWTYFYGLFE